MKPISFQCNHFKASTEEIVTTNPSFYLGRCPHIHQYATSNQRSYSKKKRKIHFALAINLLHKIFSKLLIIAYSPLRTQTAVANWKTSSICVCWSCNSTSVQV